MAWARRMVAGPAYGGGEEDEELVALGDLDGLVRRDVVRRGVEKPRALEHAGGIGEPDGVPVGLDLAGCGPAGAGAAVKVFKGGRVQEAVFSVASCNLHFTIR